MALTLYLYTISSLKTKKEEDQMKAQKHFIPLLSALFLSFFLSGPAYAQQYILIGWNDLGMHCANKDFSKIAVLPPFNNVYAQLICSWT
jgi:hypothetical protein